MFYRLQLVVFNLAFDLGQFQVCNSLQLFFLFELLFELIQLFLEVIDLLLLLPLTHFILFVTDLCLCSLGLLLLPFLLLGLPALLLDHRDFEVGSTLAGLFDLILELFVLCL